MTRIDILTGEVLDEAEEISAVELCRRCALDFEHLADLVAEGIIETAGEGPEADVGRWRFSYTSITRVRRARRLQRDLGLNLAGTALALDLLDRIAELERRLR